MKRLLVAALATMCVGCITDTCQCFLCRDFLTCNEKLDGGDFSRTFGPNGTCWTTTQQQADTCAQQCDSMYQALRQAHPGVCQ